ncbi:hypothetical protein HaLaN_01097, partial [Haematococcus lacustris]
DALQNHVTVQSSATGAGGASIVLVCPGTSKGSIRDRWHTHVSVANPSTQQADRASPGLVEAQTSPGLVEALSLKCHNRPLTDRLLDTQQRGHLT